MTNFFLSHCFFFLVEEGSSCNIFKPCYKFLLLNLKLKTLASVLSQSLNICLLVATMVNEKSKGYSHRLVYLEVVTLFMNAQPRPQLVMG